MEGEQESLSSHNNDNREATQSKTQAVPSNERNCDDGDGEANVVLITEALASLTLTTDSVQSVGSVLNKEGGANLPKNDGTQAPGETAGFEGGASDGAQNAGDTMQQQADRNSNDAPKDDTNPPSAESQLVTGLFRPVPALSPKENTKFAKLLDKETKLDKPRPNMQGQQQHTNTLPQKIYNLDWCALPNPSNDYAVNMTHNLFPPSEHNPQFPSAAAAGGEETMEKQSEQSGTEEEVAATGVDCDHDDSIKEEDNGQTQQDDDNNDDHANNVVMDNGNVVVVVDSHHDCDSSGDNSCAPVEEQETTEQNVWRRRQIIAAKQRQHKPHRNTCKPKTLLDSEFPKLPTFSCANKQRTETGAVEAAEAPVCQESGDSDHDSGIMDDEGQQQQ